MHHDFEEELAPNLYYDRHFGTDAAKILPGQYYATARDMLIVTVLGSCVSVCLRDAQSGIGGMNHFMLPGNAHDPLSESARYGAYAMEVLINHLVKLGANSRRLEAKVFGGGRVLSAINFTNVGERNAEFVREFLHTERIPVLAEDLLDVYPRKVYFFVHSGRVLVRKLKAMHNSTIVDRELEYSGRLRKEPIAGDVELFD